ncbi:hypothetical protein B9Z55_027682 [Caenorhabditis nigoni]|uniref:Uncharacterized protein n=1 Tax=Caenorhabditis nigoni TaxID=1611254 RepID=A0A2G5SET2_9PELO|nr:hypothetical protein B9Z55_027682 [Caenorhabditis nigoni]
MCFKYRCSGTHADQRQGTSHWKELLIIQKQLRFVPDGPGNVSTARVYPEQFKKVHKTLYTLLVHHRKHQIRCKMTCQILLQKDNKRIQHFSSCFSSLPTFNRWFPDKSSSFDAPA